jgi:hypothetical protein
MVEGVHDLLVAEPHTRPDAHYTPEQWRYYVEGYHWGLVIVLRVLKATEERFELIRRTRRLEATRKRTQDRGGGR